MAHKVLRILALLLAAGTCLAEDAVVAKGTVMKADRSLVSLKAGTVVEVLGRTDKTASVLYKGQTGTVPLASLGGAAAKPAAPKPVIADQPQSFYGNAVKKAEVNAAKHDDSLVKPANEVMDDTPPK
jgi:hypothetical protein